MSSTFKMDQAAFHIIQSVNRFEMCLLLFLLVLM